MEEREKEPEEGEEEIRETPLEANNEELQHRGGLPPQENLEEGEVEEEQQEIDEEKEEEEQEEEEEEMTGEEQVEEEGEEEEREQARIGEVRNFNHLLLIGENSCRFRNFAILGREAIFRLRPLPEGVEVYNWFKNAFTEIHAYALHTSELHDYVGFTFDSADLTHGSAELSFRPACDLTREDIWRLVSSVAQSAGGLDIARDFNVRVFNVAIPRDRGCVSNKLTREDVVKRSILTISNSDNLCFPPALWCPRKFITNAVRRGGTSRAECGKTSEFLITTRTRIGFDEKGWRHHFAGGLRDSGNRMFPTLSRRIRYRHYCL
ncbi:ubiquitin carboxyl-terminal hydrolase 34-like [Pogonomyrmex barbatus]|uniref:Ubiquitin carboxyl-terminal hydrolase 34-like n=1 Tax=Pogonomyrmex barbatus TaxID=144034 RepID=A0A6I9WAF0_9HYME|nr:ubiquitin carboxyl-terminal hydrolase 34-like [Pogonomyrmex barbatus]